MPSNNGGDDARYRSSRRTVYEIPYDQIDRVRDRELAAFNSSDRQDRPSQSLVVRDKGQDDTFSYDDDDVGYTKRKTVRRERFADDAQLVPYGGHDRQISRRASRASDEDDRDRQRRRRHRRARSEDNQARSDVKKGLKGVEEGAEEDEVEGADFFDRTFDVSLEGLITAVAGGALGAITARHFTSANNRDARRPGRSKGSTLKVVGGALAGAAALNAGEKQWQNWRMENEEEKQEKLQEAS